MIAALIIIGYLLSVILSITIAFYRLRKMCPDITKEEVKNSKPGTSFKQADRYYNEVDNFKGVCFFSIFGPLFFIVYLVYLFVDILGPSIIDSILNLLWNISPKESEIEKLRKELEELKKENNKHAY